MDSPFSIFMNPKIEIIPLGPKTILLRDMRPGETFIEQDPIFPQVKLITMMEPSKSCGFLQPGYVLTVDIRTGMLENWSTSLGVVPVRLEIKAHVITPPLMDEPVVSPS